MSSIVAVCIDHLCPAAQSADIKQTAMFCF